MVTHRVSSLPDVARAVAAVPADERHARAVTLVADVLDLLLDPAGVAGDVGSVLLDERRAPGTRRNTYGDLAGAVEALDVAGAAARATGDYAGYVGGFQSARAVAALAALVGGGAAPSVRALGDVAYEAAMAAGSDAAVLARLDNETV